MKSEELFKFNLYAIKQPRVPEKSFKTIVSWVISNNAKKKKKIVVGATIVTCLHFLLSSKPSFRQKHYLKHIKSILNLQNHHIK